MTTEYIELAQNIMALQRKRRHERHTKIYEPRSTTASSLGYKCDRRLVYARTMPELAEPINAELASIFEEGDLHETDVKKELLDLGIDVMDGQRILRDEVLEIGAKIDCTIPIADDHRADRIPTEIKSCTGTPPQTAEGLRNHDGIYRRYYVQMQIYLFLTPAPFGIFLFKDKITGLWHLVVVPLDYEYTEGLLKKAERVRDAVALIKITISEEEKETLLPQRLADRSECPFCPWRDSACLPSEAPVDPLLFAKDEHLLTDLIARDMLDEDRKQFKKLDDAIKTRIKLTKGDRFVCGDFLITKKVTTKSTTIKIKLLKEESNDG